MKKIFSAAIIFITLIFMIPVASPSEFSASADSVVSGFIDDADIFSDDEEEVLNKFIDETSEKLDLNIIICAAGSRLSASDYQKEAFSESSYNDMFGKNTDGVFYFMDLTGDSPAYDFIFISGKAVAFYEKNIDRMFDEIFAYMPPSSVSDYSYHTDELINAALTFLKELEKYDRSDDVVSYYDDVTNEYYKYKNGKTVIKKGPPPSRRLFPLVYALPIGFVVALVYYCSTKSKYKFKFSANPRVYVANNESSFSRRADNFIRTYTTKTKIETSSGSRSSHHSSGGGGSHHHGGGRHR